LVPTQRNNANNGHYAVTPLKVIQRHRFYAYFSTNRIDSLYATSYI